MSAPTASGARGLRLRFFLLSAILVITVLASGTWSAITFARLSRVVGEETLREGAESFSVLAIMHTAIEREDDGLLLAVEGDPLAAAAEVEIQRRRFDDALSRVRILLDSPDEHELLRALEIEVAPYRAAGDALLTAAHHADAHERYRRDVLPANRRVLAASAALREHGFRSMISVAEWARDETRSATRIVSLIALAAVIVAGFGVIRFGRLMIWPLQELTRDVEAVSRGDFTKRAPAFEADELDELAQGFNRMAENLAEFRKSDLGEALRAKRALEATLEAFPDAVFVVGAHAGGSREDILAMNRLARAVIGGPGARPRIDALPMHEDDRRAIDAVLSGRALASPPSTDFSRAVSLTLDGKVRRLLPRAVAVPGLPEGESQAIVVLTDVTDLVKLDELRLELVGVASHELRTPLTTLRMMLMMLAEDAESLTARQQEMLKNASHGCDQLSETIDAFLDLTRIEAGELRLSLQTVDLASLAHDVVQRFRARFEESGVALNADFGSVPISVAADPPRLRVVFTNILSNALKYTPRGGRVSFTLSKDSASARITIADNGHGIPEEFRDRVFDKFFRVEDRTGREREGIRGSGLGLYLSRQIAVAHGGTLQCAEAPSEGGAIFVTEIPLRRT